MLLASAVGPCKISYQYTHPIPLAPPALEGQYHRVLKPSAALRSVSQSFLTL